VILACLVASAGAFGIAPLGLRHVTAGRHAAAVSTASLSGLRMAGDAPAAAAVAGGPMPFTVEMRNKAMSLHTFSQAPKQGKQRDTSANTVVDQWETSKEDFLQFLVDNKCVYEAMEEAVKEKSLTRFQNTGLERVKGLELDIAMFEKDFSLKVPAYSDAAKDYASYILSLARTNEPAFICHFYNYYFAHTAGGRMIGQKVMDQLLGGKLINFYEWDGDVKEILAEVKTRIDGHAENWSRTQKDASLDATPETFMKSGLLLRALVGKARDRAARMNNRVAVKAGMIVGVAPSSYSSFKKPWDV